MTPEMKAAALKAFDFQADCIKDKESLPHGILYKPDDTVNVYAFDDDFMSTAPKKEMLAALILRELIEHGGVYAMCSDGWGARLPPGMSRQEMPENIGEWPEQYRTEMLLCWVNQIGHKGCHARRVYKRTASGIVFQEIEWIGEMRGRFAFDLTQASLDRAMTGMNNGPDDGPLRTPFNPFVKSQRPN